MATTQCPEGFEPQRLDVVLLISCGNSMFDLYYGKTQFEAAKAAALPFIDTFPLTVNQLSVYGPPQDTAPTELGQDREAIRAHVSALTMSSSDNMDLGADIEKCWAELVSARHIQAHKQVIIVITDALGSAANPITAAQTAKDGGARIIIIGINTDLEKDYTIAEMNALGQDFFAKNGWYVYPPNIPYVPDLHKLLASPSDYYDAYTHKLSDLFTSIGAQIQQCVDPPEDPEPDQEPIEIPDPKDTELPPEQRCPQDDCSGWQGDSDAFSKCDPGKMEFTIKLPDPVPPQPQTVDVVNSTKVDVVNSTKQYKNVCTNVIDNGGYEEVLKRWEVQRNDGYIDIPWSDDTNSKVLKFGYSGALPSDHCTQIIKIPDFDQDTLDWTVVRQDAGSFMNFVDTATCGRSLLLQRTLTGKATTCGTPNENPVPLAIDIVMGYPCTSANIENTTALDVVSLATDPNGDPISLVSVSQPTTGYGSVINNGNGTLTYVAPATWAEGQAGSSFTYTIQDDRGGSAIGTVTINCAELHISLVKDLLSYQMKVTDPPLTIDLGANTVDDEGHTTSVNSVLTPNLRGTVVNNLNGTVTFSPDPTVDKYLVDSFTYEMVDVVGTVTPTQSIQGSVQIEYLVNASEYDVMLLVDIDGSTDVGEGLDSFGAARLLAKYFIDQVAASGMPLSIGLGVQPGVKIADPGTEYSVYKEIIDGLPNDIGIYAPMGLSYAAVETICLAPTKTPVIIILTDYFIDDVFTSYDTLSSVITGSGGYNGRIYEFFLDPDLYTDETLNREEHIAFASHFHHHQSIASTKAEIDSIVEWLATPLA